MVALGTARKPAYGTVGPRTCCQQLSPWFPMGACAPAEVHPTDAKAEAQEVFAFSDTCPNPGLFWLKLWTQKWLLGLPPLAKGVLLLYACFPICEIEVIVPTVGGLKDLALTLLGFGVPGCQGVLGADGSFHMASHTQPIQCLSTGNTDIRPTLPSTTMTPCPSWSTAAFISSPTGPGARRVTTSYCLTSWSW